MAEPDAAAGGSTAAVAFELEPVGPVTARLAAPASKSVTNRVLVCAALGEGSSRLLGPLQSDDCVAMRVALAGLGAGVTVTGPGSAAALWRVEGTAGRLASPPAPLDARSSGTTMRFLSALATLTPAGATVTGRPGLRARPIGALVAALRELGARVDDHGGFPPVSAAGGGLEGGQVSVDAGASSQFASALLLAAPYARGAVTLRARALGAPAYVELTARVMRDFGAGVACLDATTWRVEAGRTYRAREVGVEHDASAAAHLFALAAATGGSVTVTNARAGSLQPDARLPELLGEMGATVTRDGSALTVSGPETLAPIDADLSPMPDQVTTVAVLAALAPGRSRLRNVAVARGHESDRLAALARELAKLGVEVEELPDGLVVHGGRPRGPAWIDPHDDHRLAMAFAALAARVPGVAIEDPGCVAKTYPGFWADLARAGLRWQARPSGTTSLAGCP
ncbi:MAG TPA: 3-phosphoshikimate 1-carboxyvinyltransferase [Actinomycetota bacterium]|nr:3-phosphoshikimate 1-carboxyvinyltransferase [Actinomycetota bacterium]